MADLMHLRQAATAARSHTDTLTAQLTDINSRLAAERQNLASQITVGDPEAIEATQQRIAALVAARSQSASVIAAAREQFRDDLDQLLGDHLTAEGTVPLMLLPVRIEVRSTADQTALRVRIFHDTIHAETLDTGITAAERKAGIEYWETVWGNGDPSAPWQTLMTKSSTRRAAWVAEALRPTNLAQRPNQPPQFPPTTDPSARQPVARTLPDRFYVRIEQDGASPKTVHGNAIPAEVPVGLTHRDELTALHIDGEDLPLVDETLRWLVDYAEAERVGMAVTVQLPLAGHPVRRLLVYGVRASLDPSDGATQLEQLIRSHRFTDGAEFLPQGTPTNNTESARTQWSKRTPPGPPTLTDPA
ncbi:MAG: hypothetical protein EOO27_41195, partial [Comamonadaceae bacterium]